MFPIFAKAFKKLISIKFLNKMHNNEKFFVMINESTDRFQVNFKFVYEPLNVNKTFNLNRSCSESVDCFLARLKNNLDKVVLKKVDRKNKKAKVEGNSSPRLTLALLDGNTPVPGSSTCAEVLSNSENLYLNIFDQEYQVCVNAPWVTSLVVPKTCYVGFLISPLNISILYGDKAHSKFVWFRSDYGMKWTEIAQGVSYKTVETDLGKFLKLECTPGDDLGRTGPVFEAPILNRIEKGPGHCPFQDRHKFTTEKAEPGCFRVVSYNILADTYAETLVARKELFHYCPSQALTLDYRKNLFCNEIIGYNADIYCLQEVDVKVFEQVLKPLLKTEGFNGHMARKGANSEGVAIFYKFTKFKFFKEILLNFSVEISENEIFQEIWNKIKNNAKFVERFQSRNTVLQILILESVEDPNQKLVVANTHLYFHPDSDHIRLVQGAMSVKYLEHLVKLESENSKISFIFCGDFNSTPDSGIYKLMTTGAVSCDSVDWKSNEEEAVKGLEVKHNLNIKSALGTPEFTNYTQGFSGCLDYIYYGCDNLCVKKTVPFPDEEILKKHTALPSPVFPSDHLALIADLKSVT